MRFLSIITLFFLSVTGGGGSALASKKSLLLELCPSVVLDEKIDPELNDTEKRLLCGDPDSPSWNHLPHNQVEFNLKNFLQDRGYFQPSFNDSPEKISVNLGHQTRVSGVQARGTPESLHLERKRKLVGEVLTPRLLDNYQGWLIRELKSEGYACAEIKSDADPDSGLITLEIKPHALQTLDTIQESDVPGLLRGILRRYDAFKLGELYNEDWLSLSERRLLSEGLVESAHFTTLCTVPKDGSKEPNAKVIQEVVAGPPRVLVLGVGVNTERGPIGRVSWKNTRLGNTSSSVTVAAQGSFKDQRLYSIFDWYFHPEPSRVSLRPLAEFKHVNEQYYEYTDTRGQVALSNTWDSYAIGAWARMGPTLDIYRTLNGPGVDHSKFLSWETQAQIQSHDFEFYLNSPRSGFRVQTTVDLNSRAFVSDATAERFTLLGEALWNYRHYDPPLWVFGVRGGLSSVLTPERPGPGTILPANYLQYLGGSTDLRGFGRQELPLSGNGSLTSVFVSLEVRKSEFLHVSLEPLFFLDLGALGDTPFQLQAPIYYSPGFGLRWASPVGVFRGTAAHGFPGELGHWQFLVSFGEEF